jgi:TonB-dependent receptor
MKNFSLIGILLIAMTTGQVFAQTGTLSGKIYQVTEGVEEIIPFAKIVSVTGGVFKPLGKSDYMGEFKFSLPEGKQLVVFSASGLQPDTVEFNIVANQVTQHNQELLIKSLDIVTVLHTVAATEATAVTAIRETQEDTKVVAVQTKSQMEEKGAGDVASATNKMTGMSTVGSVLYVRGLGDRYNVAYLNGLPIPSPNPDFRVVPLNIFPTDIVNSVQVSKVMSSELYGDFSGGAFNITTRSFYDKPTLKVSLGTGANTRTTFQDYRTYQGGRLDYFGFDDGTRQIPAYVVNNSTPATYAGVNNVYHDGTYQSVEGKTTGFNDNFGTTLRKAPVNSSFSVTAGNFFPLSDAKDKSKGFGFLALLSHNNSYEYEKGNMKIINAQSEERLNYAFEKYNQNTSSTGLLNLYYRINPNHNISFNSLFVNTSSDQTQETWGKHFDYSRNIYSRRLTYKQNFMSVNQLIGTHKFLMHKEDKNFARLTIDWRGSYNLTGSQEPDRRQFVAFYDEDKIDDTEYYAFNYLDKNENHIFYSKLTENELAGKVHGKYVLKLDENKDENGKTTVSDIITLTAGADYKSKTRQFDYKQYNYVINTLAQNQGDNVDIYAMDNYLNSEQHDEGQFYIEELANFGSAYTAKLDVMSAYADVKFRLNKLEIIPGARFESGYQSVENRNQQSPINIDKTILASNVILPSLITKYSASEKDIFRLVASKTLTRPKFNELAPFQYILYFAGVKAQGNTALQNGQNYNVDFRYERYPKPGETISIGGFYKYLDNPIEQTMRATASGQLMSFANANSANVAGVEFEYIKSLAFLVKEEKRDSSLLKHFGVGFNASYMYTQVQIDTLDGGAINTNDRRPLEGASPYLVNFDLRFQRKIGDREKNKTYLAALSYNVFGPRLFAVGSNGIGDQYERPINTVNFVGKITFNDKYSIGIKAKNLLNPAIRVVQEDKVNLGEFIDVNSFRRGIDFSISLSYNFL